MKELTSKGIVKCFGFNPVVAWAQFLPVASPALQTFLQQFGIASITRTGAGAWTVAFQETTANALIIPTGVYSDGNYHDLQVVTQTSTGFTMIHRTGTLASMGTVANSDLTGVVSIGFIVYGVHN